MSFFFFLSSIHPFFLSFLSVFLSFFSYRPRESCCRSDSDMLYSCYVSDTIRLLPVQAPTREDSGMRFGDSPITACSLNILTPLRTHTHTHTHTHEQADSQNTSAAKCHHVHRDSRIATIRFQLSSMSNRRGRKFDTMKAKEAKYE